MGRGEGNLVMKNIQRYTLKWIFSWLGSQSKFLIKMCITHWKHFPTFQAHKTEDILNYIINFGARNMRGNEGATWSIFDHIFYLLELSFSNLQVTKFLAIRKFFAALMTIKVFVGNLNSEFSKTTKYKTNSKPKTSSLNC